MGDGITICVCCEAEAEVIFNVNESKEGCALCLKHARDLQQIIDHWGNFPTARLEIIT